MRLILVPFVAPKVNIQADNFILWLGSTLGRPNQKSNIDIKYLIPIIGAYDESGVEFIANYLLHEKFNY